MKSHNSQRILLVFLALFFLFAFTTNVISVSPCGIDTAVVIQFGKVKASLSAGVRQSSPQASHFTLNPNPASGEVTVTLAKAGNSTVEIYDILGNLVVRSQAYGEYVWSGETQSGAAEAGVYIVRVSERGPGEATSVSSKRLVFRR